MRVPINGTKGDKPKPDLPPAVEKALTFYDVKGLFGVSLTSTEDKINGVIFLIEWCDTTNNQESGPLDGGPDSGSTGDCNGEKVYVYCATQESDSEPMNNVSMTMITIIALS